MTKSTTTTEHFTYLSRDLIFLHTSLVPCPFHHTYLPVRAALGVEGADLLAAYEASKERKEKDGKKNSVGSDGETVRVIMTMSLRVDGWK